MEQINKCVLLLISGILSVSFVCICSAFENEPDNFRGIKWGTTLTDLPHMVIQRTRGEEEICRRKNDKMQIGNATLDTLEYAFYKKRFYAVFIKYKGHANYLSLMDTLSYVYGKYDGTGIPVVTSFYWEGATVTVRFRYYSLDASELGIINYFYKPICDEKVEFEKRSGAGDL